MLFEKIKTLIEDLSFADPQNKAYLKIEDTDIKINFYDFLSFYVSWLQNPQNKKKIKEMIYLEISETIPPFVDMTEEEVEKLKFSLGCQDKDFKKIFQPLLPNIEIIADNIDQEINIICLNEILDKTTKEEAEQKKKFINLYQNNN